ncbi:MAG: hypothetical protein ACI825_000995 [Planctomycetota bacterium]|jgi:hypothetical protein|uniref:transporter n=1 Tax=Patiriisocius sp. Uisw_047 TaxID=3230969 RepID=UPI0039E794BB
MINLISLRKQMFHMHQRFFLTILLAIGYSVSLFAQYTDELNSNRPGSSQGAFSVGTKVLQFEAGLSLGKEDHRLVFTETDAFMIDYAVRYGVWKEALEVSIMGSFQNNNVGDTRMTAQETSFSNFRSNTIGAKYLLFDPYLRMEKKGPNLYSWKANRKIQWADFIPAVSLYAGLNIDFIEDPEGKFVNNTRPGVNSIGLSPKVVLATQNNFVGGFVLVTNIYANRVTDDAKQYGYVVTLTHTPTSWFSIFVENEGFKGDTYADQLFRGGAAALLSPNFQVDASVLLNFKDTPNRTYGRIGVSYRIDRHEDEEFIEDKGADARKEKRDKKNKNKDAKKAKKKKRKDGVDPEQEEDDGGKL